MAGNALMSRSVLDSSVIIKWFSSRDEQDLEAALAVRSEAVSGSVVIAVPDLLFYEVANALRHNPSFTAEDVALAVRTLHDLEFEVHPPDTALLRRSVEIAYENGVTVYDSCFLALAERLDSPFITADYRFMTRLKDTRRVIRLDEYGNGSGISDN